MTKREEYKNKLQGISNWDEYLLKELGLPGPRGNIELAQVVADEGDKQLFERYLTYTADKAPVNSPYEFLAFCGVLGLGRLLAEGDIELLETIRNYASDPRWRIREGVAMALQRWGDVDMEQLIIAMHEWSYGNPYEQRAAAAGLCEPRFLVNARHAKKVLDILDEITSSIKQLKDRRNESCIALKKGLGYCWSVAVVALPSEGKAMMEKWAADPDGDIRWIMKENLTKARLIRMDANWVKQWRENLQD